MMLTFFVDPGFDDFGVILGRRGREKVNVEETDLVVMI
jgi:hypothetical protein